MEGGKWVNDEDDEYFASGYRFSLARHAADVGEGEISLRIGNKGFWRTGYGRLRSTVYGLPSFGETKKNGLGLAWVSGRSEGWMDRDIDNYIPTTIERKFQKKKNQFKTNHNSLRRIS